MSFQKDLVRLRGTLELTVNCAIFLEQASPYNLCILNHLSIDKVTMSGSRRSSGRMSTSGSRNLPHSGSHGSIRGSPGPSSSTHGRQASQDSNNGYVSDGTFHGFSPSPEPASPTGPAPSSSQSLIPSRFNIAVSLYPTTT